MTASSGPDYYVMTCDGVPPVGGIRRISDVPSSPWMHGALVEHDAEKRIVFSVDPEERGELKAMYEGGVPLMRHDLLKAVRDAGVDNLQIFPAVIRDKKKKKQHSNYKAINIVGVVACADTGESVMAGTSSSTLIDADFDSLVIDGSKTGGALLFRLAEAVSAIIVHEKVKKVIEDSGIPGMMFYGPGEWSG